MGTRTIATALTDAAALIALIAGADDTEHAALRLALKARVTPEAAAASEAYIGKGFACTAKPACGRTFRTAGRASIHGVEQGGHTAAK